MIALLTYLILTTSKIEITNNILCFYDGNNSIQMLVKALNTPPNEDDVNPLFDKKIRRLFKSDYVIICFDDTKTYDVYSWFDIEEYYLRIIDNEPYEQYL